MAYMLNPPASTRVTTHLALRYKGERRELARGMMTYFMQSETVHISKFMNAFDTCY